MTQAGVVLAQLRALPYASLAQIIGEGAPLILAPHPDDEVIGCGGLIAQAAANNRSPVIVFVTDGSASHPRSRKWPPRALAELRQREARAAASVLGVAPERLYFLGIPDSAAPHDGPGFANAIADLIDIAGRTAAGTILAPWAFDPHTDHLAVHRMACCIARASGQRHLSYPVWGWTLPQRQELGNVPVKGWRLRIRKDLKGRALREHKSQTTDLIDDDPLGFRLNEATLGMMLSDDEVFLANT